MHVCVCLTDLLHDALDDVELIPAYNDLLPLIQGTQCLQLRFNPGTQTVP